MRLNCNHSNATETRHGQVVRRRCRQCGTMWLGPWTHSEAREQELASNAKRRGWRRRREVG